VRYHVRRLIWKFAMPDKEPVPVHHAVLVWARRSASVPADAAAKAAGVEVDRLEAWERGDGTPTLPQLRKLAAKYHRPLAVMLLPEPPADFAPLRDFRRVEKATGQPTPMPPRVAYEIRLAHERREIALEMLEETGGEVDPFPLVARLSDETEQAGLALRAFFGVKRDDIALWTRKGTVFDGWRTAIEARDILVFVMGGPHGPAVREVRGFAIVEKAFPVVVVNGKDRSNGRTFTLLHEVAHLMLGQSIVENAVAPEPGMPQAVRRIEKWCNAVAAAALMPVETVLELTGGHGADAEWGDAELADVATRMGVSREAALIRFVTLGRASPRGYFRRRPAFEEEYLALDEPSKSNAQVAPYKTMVGKYGRPYARLVISSYRDQHITLNDAAAFLGVQAKHVGYLERQAFKAA
jgi:Zn-dependent peptidase ImmA (M78 family)/transcriptional regulator with XRE-family HTH domain